VSTRETSGVVAAHDMFEDETGQSSHTLVGKTDSVHEQLLNHADVSDWYD
jgi:hypothetical protein